MMANSQKMQAVISIAEKLDKSLGGAISKTAKSLNKARIGAVIISAERLAEFRQRVGERCAPNPNTPRQKNQPEKTDCNMGANMLP
jgi:hypothetical protein